MGLRVKFLITALSCLALANCNFYHQKAAQYYLNKAEKLSMKQEVSEKEITTIYQSLSKALDHNPKLGKTLEISDAVAKAAASVGYMKAEELNMELINKYIKLNKNSWSVYLHLISVYSVKGDIINLENLSSKILSFSSSLKNEDKLAAKILTATIYMNIIPWAESQGYLSVNSSSDNLLNNLARYADYTARAASLRDEIKNEAGKMSSLDREITYAYEIALVEAFKNEKEIKKNIELYRLSKSDSNFLKALQYTIDANAYLAKKEYSNARLYYKAALNNYPRMINAKKQTIETNFQEAMSLSLSQKGYTDLRETLYDSYSEISDIITDFSSSESMLPFVSNDKFLSECYTLKAALLTALNTVENFSEKKKERVKKDIDFSINKAIELYPKNKLAKEIFERTRKDEK